MGNRLNGSYAIHLVNKGATRQVVLTGLPAEITQLDLYTTGREKSFEKAIPYRLATGEQNLHLRAQVTLA